MQRIQLTPNSRFLVASFMGSVILTNLYFLTIVKVLSRDILTNFVLPLTVFLIVGINCQTIPRAILASFLTTISFAIELFCVILLPFMFNLIPNNATLFFVLNFSFVMQIMFFLQIEALLGCIGGVVLYEFL